MATSLRELIVSVTADTSKYQREMDRASRMGAQYFKSVQQGGAQASQSWGAQTAAARTHATAVEASAQAISRYAAVAAGAFSVGTLIGMADDWGQISARIRIATSSSDEFALAQRRLLEIANRTYRDFNEAADQFAGTAQSMREMGFAAADTLDAAEALGLALVAGGSNAQRGAAANDAWAKSMVQGRIATDQFQTLLLQTPRVVQALGEGLGKTTAELQQMAKDGQLTAQVVVPALTSQMGKLRAEVESMPTTVQDAGIRFRNELRAWVGGQNEAFGATQVLVSGLEAVSGNLDTLITIGGAAALGAVAAKMAQIGSATAKAAVSAVQSRAAIVAEAVAVRDATLQGQLKAQADLRRAQSAMTAARGTAESARQSRNLAAALIVERQATLAAAQAEVAMGRALSGTVVAKRAALALLGGPAGLAITLGTVAAGWLLFRDNTSAAAQALLDMQGPLDEVIAKYREMNEQQQAGALLKMTERITEQMEAVRAASLEMTAMAQRDIGGVAAETYFYAVRDLNRELAAGKIAADEHSSRLAALNARLLDGAPAAARLNSRFVEQTALVADASREVERQRGVMDALSSSTEGAAGSAAVGAQAMRVLGDSSEEATKKISAALLSLPGQIERVGKTAREVAALDVRDALGSAIASGTSGEALAKLVQDGERYIALQGRLEDAQKASQQRTKALRAAPQASEADQQLQALNERYAELAQSQEREIALYGQAGQAAQLAYDLANGALAGLTEGQKDYLLQLAQQRDALEANTRAAAEYAALAQRYATPRERAQQETKGDRSGAWMALISGEVDDKGYQDLMDRIEAKAKLSMGNIGAYADQAARNIQSYLGDSMFNVLDGKFSDIGDSFEQMIKRMLSELAASQLLGLLGGALSGYSGTGGFGNFVRGVGGAIQTQGGRAGGGQVKPFSAYDVTEHGPELLQYGGRQVLMMGAQGGLVSPLMQMRGGGAGEGGGGALRVEIVNNGTPARVESASMSRDSDGRQLLRMVLGAVAEDLANGGIVAQAGKGRFGWRDQ